MATCDIDFYPMDIDFLEFTPQLCCNYCNKTDYTVENCIDNILSLPKDDICICPDLVDVDPHQELFESDPITKPMKESDPIKEFFGNCPFPVFPLKMTKYPPIEEDAARNYVKYEMLDVEPSYDIDEYFSKDYFSEDMVVDK